MHRSLGPRLSVVPAVLWLLAGIGWLIGEAVTASAFPAYSYATNYISDLGVPDVGIFQGRTIDSPLSAVMNTVFIGHGVLFALAGLLVARAVASTSRSASRAVAVLVVAHFVGITLVGLFHGSQASVDDGAIVLHVLGAAVAITSGNVVAIVAGASSRAVDAPRGYRVASIVLGVVGLVSLVMLLVDSGSTAITLLPDGVWERASVYTIIAWELLSGGLLLTGVLRRRAAARA
ncbi:DUF998 domain-containing protein [Curtobacterium sp. ZW137]|uniref:DUF998 domain-containing protein n=1 Tax=Curtobacterium sp. ZW137 TaxID=2485104 RepID=UPI000F4C5049|nr:DUF998 domain-containing protein [Curtobacterium sp. ZW137]ROP63908.1 uncharacterized protein DUF998 [Curtobacterium sp. ZW137]